MFQYLWVVSPNIQVNKEFMIIFNKNVDFKQFNDRSLKIKINQEKRI